MMRIIRASAAGLGAPPQVVGSPYSPEHPTIRRLAYVIVSLLIAMMANLGNSILLIKSGVRCLRAWNPLRKRAMPFGPSFASVLPTAFRGRQPFAPAYRAFELLDR